MNRSRTIPIAVTGIGVYSPLGKSAKELWQRIESGDCAVQQIKGFPTEDLNVRHAAEITTHNPEDFFESEEERKLDWTAQFGIIAARQALEDAALESDLRQSARLGLVIGVCAGGQGLSPLQRSIENPFDIALETFPETSIFKQTDAIGQALAVHGPRSTVSTACASSGSALGYAYELLQSGRAEAILTGGTDAFSISTYAGFYALGAMPSQPISPFSENIGVSFGEGAGFVMLEPLDRAQARGAKVYGLLLGWGCSGDAHHVTAPHPSGEGLQRAMSLAVQRSGATINDIDYINAHGTGTRDNDKAESSAIRELFRERGTTPPVSSSKSQFGHTLGAAGILEFIVSILAQQESKLPPTVNFVAARPGCDLDYVTNQARPAKIRSFLSNSSAFGGINVSVLGGALECQRFSSERVVDELWITGIGIVSPIGCGIDEYRSALIDRKSGFAPIHQFTTEGCLSHHAAMLGDFQARKLAPTIDVRRTDPLNRYAMVAAALALKNSKLEIRAANSDRVGMVMTLNYGSIAVQERFRDSLVKDGIEKMSAKHFPSMVVSTVGGTVSQAFNLRGPNSTVVEGITGGLHGIIHAAEMLYANANHDAMVIVGADEVGSLLFRTFDKRGWLAPTSPNQNCELGPYQSGQRGWLLGEGGVAIVVERASAARARGATPLATIAGYGLTADAVLAPTVEPSGKWHECAITSAIKNAHTTAESIDLVYGHGRGNPAYDAREITTFKSVFGTRTVPLGCVMGNVGVAGSSCGLFSTAAAILSIKHREAYPVVGTTGDLVNSLQLVREHQTGDFRQVLVTGSTENGNNAAMILKNAE